MRQLRFLRSVSNLKGTRVLVRIDANVPSADHGIGDAFRIDRVIPTLECLVRAGAKTIVISHREERDRLLSLSPVADYLAQKLPVSFFDGSIPVLRNSTINDGTIVVLENLRNDPREEANDITFAHELATLGDIYVDDAFGVMHRNHASIVGVPRLIPAFGGMLLEDELKNLGRVLDCSTSCIAVIGGLKFATKAPLIERFVSTADRVFVVGALANSFYKARGYEIGTSTVDPDFASVMPYLNHEKIVVPQDVVVDRGGHGFVVPASHVLPGERIVDAGPSLLEKLNEAVGAASTVLWNGPLGLYEAGYGEGTEKFARSLAHAPGFRVIGGGDTIAAVSTLGLLDNFNFASTGGGAMLDYLAKGTLPGLYALEESADLFPNLG